MNADQLRSTLATAATARPLLASWGVREAVRGHENLVAIAARLGSTEASVALQRTEFHAETNRVEECTLAALEKTIAQAAVSRLPGLQSDVAPAG